MNFIKKAFSFPSKMLWSKVNDRIKQYKIAHSVIRSNPLFYNLSYQFRLSRSRDYNSEDNILIIGCFGSIGSALCDQFVLKGANIFGTYYKMKAKVDAIPSENLFQLDISSSKSIINLLENLKKKRIYFDLIIVATGDFPLSDSSKKDFTEITNENLEKEQNEILNTININAIGPYLIFRTLLPLMRESKKRDKFISQFCVLTSSLGTMYNEIYGGLYPYRVSKGALHSIFLGVYCDVRRHRNIGILMAGPGSVKSKMNPFGIISPEKSAKNIIKNLEFSSRKANYQFLGLGGKRIPW